MQGFKKVIIVTSLATLFAGTVVSTAVAQGGRGHGHGHKGINIERMAEKLDLSNTQLAEVRNIVDSSRDDVRQYRTSLKENRQQVRELMQADSVDGVALRSLADTQGDIVAELTVQRVQMMTAIRGVLDAEQQVQFDELSDKRKRRGHHHSHR